MISFQPLAAKEAVSFFRKKGLLKSFAWQDVWQEQHAISFTVAKSAGYDILGDVFGAVKSAVEEGRTFEMFRKELTPTLIKKGWWGIKEQVDPLTGKIVKVQLGSRRRLKIIYDTNLRMARAAGAWERIERVKKSRPFLFYNAILDGRTRPLHRAWHGTILPVDDPWWDTHYPPNGWRCRCTVHQWSARDMKRRKLEVSKKAPEIKNKSYTNPRTGEVIPVPKGIDPGFGYNIGKANLRAMTPSPSSVPMPQGQSLSKKPVGNLGPLPVVDVPSSRLLADNLAEEEYYQKFAAEFGFDAKGGIFTDVTGTPLPINDLLFKFDNGRWKSNKRGRGKFMLLLADTLRDPAEIWEEMVLHRKSGKYFLDRRYLARFNILENGIVRDGIVAFEMRDRKWYGSTVFSPEGAGPTKKRRRGNILYKKGKNK